MISANLSEFERNRYFYGKLLTASDFITEQTYFNNKRRMLNRALYGSGVISGLGTMQVDEQSIAVEEGLALDCLGREILVPKSVVMRLDSISGYDRLARAEAGSQAAYLCIEYSETEIEPIHSIAKNAFDDENDGPEHNKICEGYSFFLTAEPPKGTQAALVRKTLVTGELTITTMLPQVVQTGEAFYIEVDIEKGDSENFAAAQFELELEGMTSEGEHHISFSFDEAEHNKRIKLMAQSEGQGVIRFRKIKGQLGAVQLVGEDSYAEVVVVKNHPLAKIEALRKNALAMENNQIYLARLNIFTSPQYYIMERVEELTISQIIPTVQQLGALNQLTYFSENTIEAPPTVESAAEAPVYKTGIVNITIPPRAKKNRIYFSDEIPHGLGIGMVSMTAGLICGDEVAFDEQGILSAKISYAIKLSRQTGTFKIGVRPNRDMMETSFSFCWSATRLPEMQKPERRLIIYPDVKYLGRHESVQLEAKLPDGRAWLAGELEWTVHPQSGGQITELGRFTAMDTPGFYEIRAKSIAEPDLTAISYVVVR